MVTLLHGLTEDPELDVQLVDVRRPLEEAFRNAENAGDKEPIGFIADARCRGAHRILEELFVPGALEEFERLSYRIVGAVARLDLAYAIHQVSPEAAELLRDVPLEPDLWNVAVLDDCVTVASVYWHELLHADLDGVIARAKVARRRAAGRTQSTARSSRGDRVGR